MTEPRYALITGASSGIGAAFADLAVAKGFGVGLVARRAERLEALAARLHAKGAEADVFPADLSSAGAAEALAADIAARRPRVDMLINNAGATIVQNYAGANFADHRSFLELTIVTPAALTHALLPGMLERRWGRIINVSSIAALSSGAKGNTLYPAGKSFLLKFSQSLNAEVRTRGVFVTAVLPGFVSTEFQAANAIPMEENGAARRFAQTAAEVARESWARNDKGHEIVVPGAPPKIAAALMRALPEPLMRALTRRAAEKYYVGD